ncbi:MAG: hypothetical protein JOZ25_07035 [Actinobacteria bacterium]|nr:hypothetical protein [Actinomycetota bacterium]
MDQERRPDRVARGRPFDDVTRARRFQRKLDQVRPGRGYARPPDIEYDESGFPLEEKPLGVAGRLRRLITG